MHVDLCCGAGHYLSFASSHSSQQTLLGSSVHCKYSCSSFGIIRLAYHFLGSGIQPVVDDIRALGYLATRAIVGDSTRCDRLTFLTPRGESLSATFFLLVCLISASLCLVGIRHGSGGDAPIRGGAVATFRRSWSPALGGGVRAITVRTDDHVLVAGQWRASKR